MEVPAYLYSMKARGMPKPPDVTDEQWAQASPVATRESAVTVIRAQVDTFMMKQAEAEPPTDAKSALKLLVPLAVAAHAEAMLDPDAKRSDQLAAARTVIEYELGKAPQTVEHVGSLALTFHNNLDKIARGIKSGHIIDVDNLLPKPDAAVDAFVKRHMPVPFIVGRKQLDKEEPTSEGLHPGTGESPEA